MRTKRKLISKFLQRLKLRHEPGRSSVNTNTDFMSDSYVECEADQRPARFSQTPNLVRKYRESVSKLKRRLSNRSKRTKSSSPGSSPYSLRGLLRRMSVSPKKSPEREGKADMSRRNRQMSQLNVLDVPFSHFPSLHMSTPSKPRFNVNFDKKENNERGAGQVSPKKVFVPSEPRSRVGPSGKGNQSSDERTPLSSESFSESVGSTTQVTNHPAIRLPLPKIPMPAHRMPKFVVRYTNGKCSTDTAAEKVPPRSSLRERLPTGFRGKRSVQFNIKSTPPEKNSLQFAQGFKYDPNNVSDSSSEISEVEQVPWSSDDVLTFISD